MSFLGRESELQLLTRALEDPASGFIPIYGRRRVGKSELILRFMEGQPGLYFLGKEAPATEQIQEFLLRAAEAVGEPLLATQRVDDWATALRLLDERMPSDTRFVLALDEFQWTAGASPELPSVLQELWDRSWRDSGRILLILCGSYIGFMEREVLGRNSPLFGRRTAAIRLGPFPFREARQFHPHWSLEESARAHFICGGVAAYLKTFRPDRSVEQNILEVVLSEFGVLREEPIFLLREELREPKVYNALLSALAEGRGSATEVARRAGVPERGVTYYLDQLQRLGFVRRRYPLTDKRPSKRSVRFELHDPLLRFWFRFVWPNLSALAVSGPERVWERRIRPQLPSWYGTCFEVLCRDALPQLYDREGVSAAFEVGEYWDRSTQIDLVGLRDDAWTDLGECKWGRLPSPSKVVAALEAKVGRYPNARNATIGRRVFVRDAPAPAGLPENVRWHTLRDLYGESQG